MLLVIYWARGRGNRERRVKKLVLRAAQNSEVRK
jgi:hypothetical protein